MTDLTRKSAITVWLIALAMQAVLLGFYLIMFNNGFSENPNDWGVFGDYVGGVMSPVIGLFTLFIVIQAYLLQRTELEETKRALAKSADVSVIQSKIDILRTVLEDDFASLREAFDEQQRLAGAAYDINMGWVPVMLSDGTVAGGGQAIARLEALANKRNGLKQNVVRNQQQLLNLLGELENLDATIV